MNNKHSKKKEKKFEEDIDFDGDIEEEYEVEEDNINKIANKLQSKLFFNKNNQKNKEKINNPNTSSKSKKFKKLKNSSINKKINKNIKEKEYLESNISNSVISDISNPKTTKSYSSHPNPLILEININSEMKKKIDGNEKQKNLSLISQNSNINLQQNIKGFDTFNTSNSLQLDNSEFLLNKLKGNKLLQELKLKQALKNKYSYYGKEHNNEIDNKNINEIFNHDNNIVFNIIDNKNNINEKLNKSNEKNINKNDKNEKKKINKINYLNRRINRFYFRYVLNCSFKCYCKKLCKRNRRYSSINIIRNIFIFLVICSAIGFYSIIIFYDY